MMINAVSFTSRGTMLTNGLKSAGEGFAAKSYEYLGVGKIFKNTGAEKAVARSVYQSPFALIDMKAENAVRNTVKTVSNEPAMSYALSHGTPEANVGGRVSFIG